MFNKRVWARGLAAVAAVHLAASASSAATMSLNIQQTDRNNLTGTLGTVDLTQTQGAASLDWVKPVAANLAFAEKNNATALSLSTLGTAFTVGDYTNDGFTFSWSGGAPADSGGVSGTSVHGSNVGSAAVGQGFRAQFTAPASGNYTLVYYTAANGLTAGNFTLAGHVDGSGTNLATASSGANIGGDSVDELVWTAQIAADSAGQVFDLDLTRTGGTTGAIAITGASVTPEPSAVGLLAVGGLGLLRRRRRARRR